jgi:hypothetical protein
LLDKPGQQEIDQFKLDIAVLKHYYSLSNEKIAEKMRMKKSNFSKYFNQKIPITFSFLKDFNDAWDEKLMVIYKLRVAAYNTDPLPPSVALENSQSYSDSRDELIATLNKNNELLIDLKLALATNQQLMTALLAQKGEKPGNQSGEK